MLATDIEPVKRKAIEFLFFDNTIFPLIYTHFSRLTWGYGFVVSTRLSILKTNAAVFPVPDCDCAIMFWGGSASKVGRAVSCILLGALNPNGG